MSEEKGIAPLSNAQFWLLNGAAGIAGVLLLSVILLHQGNVELRTEVNQRAQFVQQTVPLGKLNNEIIKALAGLSAKHEDPELRSLLESHGIRYEIKPTQAGAQ